MIPELAEQNFRASQAASQYFNALVDKLDEFIQQFSYQQSLFSSSSGYVESLTVEKIKDKIDPRGQSFTEFTSPIAVVKLYRNRPVGWVYGEVEQHVPWIGRKCFAICPKPNSYTDLTPRIFGCYSFGDRFPKAYLVAKQVMIDLAQGDIVEEQIEKRTTVMDHA